MDFATPTSKEEMYTILREIFNYYRTVQGTFERQPLVPLELERMEYTAPTENELKLIAEKKVAASHKREILKRKDNLTAKIEMIDTKIAQAEENLQKETEEIKKLYSESARKIEVQSMKNGLVRSGIVVDKLAALEVEKNKKILEINSEKNELITEYESQKTYLQNQIDSCESYYQEIHDDEVAKVLEELKEESKKTEREVFEYNNGLDEKEQRYDNQIIKHNASVELRYLEISSVQFSKNQLIDMGYYEDVIECVTSYYNTLSPLNAYREVAADTKIKVYLEDYYSQVLAAYESLADVS